MSTSPIRQWLADLALLPDVDAGNWQAFRHELVEHVLGGDELPSRLAALGPVSGWLSETGRVMRLQQSVIDLRDIPLEGEFFHGDRHWQLSCLPRGRWLLLEHRLQPCTAAEATHLGEPVAHLLAGVPGGRLRYWRLWSPGPDNAPQCALALLADIEESRP